MSPWVAQVVAATLVGAAAAPAAAEVAAPRESRSVAFEPGASRAPGASRVPGSPDADDVPLGQIRLRPFGAADGLRNLVVVGIAQDGDGLLWVATDDGVYRYDGQQFTHYS